MTLPEYVAVSTANSGVPLKVEDPAVLAAVVTLVRAASNAK